MGLVAATLLCCGSFRAAENTAMLPFLATLTKSSSVKLAEGGIPADPLRRDLAGRWRYPRSKYRGPGASSLDWPSPRPVCSCYRDALGKARLN